MSAEFNPSTTCHDCGGKPFWKYGPGHLCRSCMKKGGDPTHIEIDLDDLEAVLGPDLAAIVIDKCRYNYDDSNRKVDANPIPGVDQWTVPGTLRASVVEVKLTYYCDTARHLVCIPYSVDNLHEMAKDLGIHICWFHRDASYAHYDIPKRRFAEIAARCQVVRSRAILAIVKGAKT